MSWSPRFNKIITIENNTITFIVKNNGVFYTCVIDEEDKCVLENTWSLQLNKSGTPKKVRARSSDGHQIALHRIIMNAYNPSIIVDHIDGNVLNNCKNNLRKCTNSQNSRNTKIRSNNSSGFKGVSFLKKINKYRAYIVINYKQINLGVFDTAKQAALAYNNAAMIYHGEFAKT